MSTFLPVLNNHVRKLAKREVKSQLADLRRKSAVHRRDIAALKRIIAAVIRQIRSLGRSGSSTSKAGASALVADGRQGVRFSARSVRAQRRRLGLSAEQYAKLVGVSALTIYHWEAGKSRPRDKQLASLVAVRGIGKREALARLDKTN